MVRRSIRFLLNGELIELDNVEPTYTVLEYLREHCTLTGTKEGCAEGDCGACMVVVAETVKDQVRYQPINSCIQFLATLDGKALITVEGLAKQQVLHPAQQAMVEHHGSQCGFCTPGFVMTLFALHAQRGASPSPTDVDDALAGNLCRCTGYRPIIDAAQRMYDIDSDWSAPWGDDTQLKARLAEIAPGDLETGTADDRFFAPRSLDGLSTVLLEHPDATILAGGTDVGLWVTKQYRDLPTIVSVGAVDALKQIDSDDTHWIVGAGVTFSDLMPVLSQEYPELNALLRRWASPPIRNAATIGGNIANGSPIGDSMPPLMALGTEVVLRRGNAVRTVALESLYHDYMVNDLQPGEFVLSVRIPRRRADQRVAAYKISKRFDQDISALCMGISVTLRDQQLADVRIAFGGMAGTVKRATHAEAALEDQACAQATFEQAANAVSQDFQPMTDMRASADYRLRVAGNLIRRFGQALLASDSEPLEVYDLGR